jgi:hypothetical protein
MSSSCVPLDRVRFDARAWPREYLDAERVEDFASLYREEGASVLPPIEVVADAAGGFLLADGVHRSEAARAAGLVELPASFLTSGSATDPITFAYLRALECSAISAKPLTRAEKQAAIARLIEERPTASDREIGRLVGADHKTVGRIRRAGLPAEGSGVPRASSPKDAAKRLFRGFEKVYEARGLGIAEFFSGDRTGERLAEVLEDVYGERALERAQRFQVWLERAVEVLEGEEA